MHKFSWATTALAALFTGAMASPTATEIEMAPNACTSDMPAGLGPSVTPDTPAAFLAYSAFSANATAYTTANNYVNVAYNQQAWAEKSNVTAMAWLNLASYDVATCATLCDDTAGCNAFDIFYQRSPTVAPSFNSSCPDPASMTTIMCWIFSDTLAATDMINSGETRGQFQVVIAGSNLFNKI